MKTSQLMGVGLIVGVVLGLPTGSAAVECVVTGAKNDAIVKAIKEMMDNFNGRNTAQIEKDWHPDVVTTRKEHDDAAKDHRGKGYPHERHWSGEYKDGKVSNCTLQFVKSDGMETNVIAEYDFTTNGKCKKDHIMANMTFRDQKLYRARFEPKPKRQDC